MLHLSKLAVGVRDIAELGRIQAERAASDPPLRHRTRHFPRRAAEILQGGSIYWVIGGAMVVRQAITAIRRDQAEDQTACTQLLLDPHLVPVCARLIKPFQGWRYLPGADAPADLPALARTAMPETLLRDLRALGLV